MAAAWGKMCEPREKYQRRRGKEEEAGRDWSCGMEVREVVRREPEARRERVEVRVWVRRGVVILGYGKFVLAVGR